MFYFCSELSDNDRRNDWKTTIKLGVPGVSWKSGQMIVGPNMALELAKGLYPVNMYWCKNYSGN